MNINRPKVSIIIPCFNHGHFLKEAIESVERCDPTLFEAIIVNDGSTDPTTLEYFKDLSRRGYSVLHHNRNLGLAEARNNAIRASKGRYILPLDSDNKIRPRYLVKGIESLDRNSEVGVVYGDAEYFGERSGLWRISDFNRVRMIHHNYIDACAVFRKELWEDCGGYDTQLPAQLFEDWDLWLGAVSRGWQFHHCREILFDYRYRSDSMARRASVAEHEQTVQYLFRKHWKLIRSEMGRFILAGNKNKRASLNPLNILRRSYRKLKSLSGWRAGEENHAALIFSRRLVVDPFLRSFSRADLKPVPQDWCVKGPDFVGVGAGKAGTSWWYSLLLEHPQVQPNRLGIKELNYFNRFLYPFRSLTQDEISTYQDAFRTSPGMISGEWSPGYFRVPFCIEHLAAAAPETKVFLILRNPIDRTRSGINEILASRAEFFRFTPPELRLFKSTTVYPESVLTSLYAASLRRLLKCFKKDQVLILQYEKCVLDPEQEIKKTYQFLQIDPAFTPKFIPWKMNERPYLLPPLSREERRRLAAYFWEDVQRVKEMLPEEIDLSLWPDFTMGSA